MEGYNYNIYAALADTIKIEDITSNEQNQTILRQLKENDPDLKVIYLFTGDDEADSTNEYIPDKDEDIGWLGYFIGQCTTLHELHFCYDNDDIKRFYRELRCNKSIKKVQFYGCSGMNPIEEEMAFFFQNNYNLTTIHMEDCQMKAEGVRQLELAIGGCSKSLKQLRLIDTERYGEDGRAEDIDLANVITAIGNHTQLEELDLNNNSIGLFCREELPALATTFRAATQLKTLNLYLNDIDDEGIEALVDSLSNGNQLQELNLSANREITISGWMAVATLLEMPDSKLEKLDISGNFIRDEEACIFASALRSNSSLKTLDMKGNFVTTEGWWHFSRLLCNISSFNNTYLSNHTLEYVLVCSDERFHTPPVVHSYLVLNRSRGDKWKVAMAKMFLNHSHIDMQPFFEWELKILPLMIGWFTRAATFSFIAGHPEKINQMKLAVIYDFIKEFPMLYIEPVTRKEIAECTALEKELINKSLVGDKESRLKEIRRCKARAIRRLQ